VVANSTWDAIQGRHALKTELDKGPSGDESTESLRELFREHKTTAPGFVPVNQGDAPQALTGAGRKVDAFYELPFQAHATMEPMNTTVHVREDWIEVWSPTTQRWRRDTGGDRRAGSFVHRFRLRVVPP
jgi:isoquinoline 1-oxidoreductase subunit beta